MTCCSVVSFDSRLSDGKVPARSEKLVTMRQKSSSAIRDGSESPAASGAAASHAAAQAHATITPLTAAARTRGIAAIVVRAAKHPCQLRGPPTLLSYAANFFPTSARFLSSEPDDEGAAARLAIGRRHDSAQRRPATAPVIPSRSSDRLHAARNSCRGRGGLPWASDVAAEHHCGCLRSRRRDADARGRQRPPRCRR